MATMMKEKPRAKKKTKEKRITNSELPDEVPSVVNVPVTEDNEPSKETITSQNKSEEKSTPSTSSTQDTTVLREPESAANESLLEAPQSSNTLNTPVTDTKELCEPESAADETLLEAPQSSNTLNPPITETCTINYKTEKTNTSQNDIDQTRGIYKDVCHRLDIISFKDVPVNPEIPIEELESNLESATYISQNTDQTQSADQSTENISIPAQLENTAPSAPMFEESLTADTPECQDALEDTRPVRLQCMPLEVAMHICGGREMAEVREMSEREEAIAESGILLRPEHPLVDLLSTYRRSAIALEQEKLKILKGYEEEEKSRSALWKVEKRTVVDSGICKKCQKSVSYQGTYEYATLLKEKLPAAQLRLESLLREAQESYCHHQHQALLAYFQIEEFISEIVQGSTGDIREALTLVLQELRASGASVCLLKMEYFPDSLRRWARALCGALLARSDPRQLLFLLHQLFRQSHSVQWAAPLIRVPMSDFSDAARALAMLDLMLAAPVLETAKECTEENEEMWEEVDRHGDAGAVSEGALRERDLLALLKAFPLRALVARLVLLQRADITQTRPYEWQLGARDVLRACCGLRALLAVLARAAHAHAGYARLRAELRALAAHAMHAVAALHTHNSDSYPKELAVQIEAELEAVFVAGWALLAPRVAGADGAHTQLPPTRLLRPAVRAAYCVALMTHIHEKPPIVIDCLSLELTLSCGQCVYALTQAADAGEAAETLAMIVDFLVQVALKPTRHCNGECVDAARACLPALLAAHEYLLTRAVHSVAYVHQLEPFLPSAAIFKPFCLNKWRPSAGEIRAVLDDWSQRSPQLLQYLLHELSYTPYDGLSLESQLAVGSWLCGLPAPAPDWAWSLLTKLRVHRWSWRLALEAPPPERAEGVFAEAYAVLSSSWGHSLPLICECGLGALARVAAARAPAAAHALPLVAGALTSSPESVALTPQFASLIATLLAPPQSLVQWARGERAAAPEILLRRILAHVESQPSPADRDAAVSTWLHGLCHTGLAGAKLAACDAVLLAARHTYSLQEAPKPEVVSHLVRNAQHAPLTCAAALLAAHAQRELTAQLFPRLLHALGVQRAQGQRIHVDNALKQIGSSMSSEELVIHQTAAALLIAPLGSTLPLWRLFMHLYLHSSNISSDPAPIGPLFFSGLIKSRTLAQLKKRLHETIIHHHTEAESFRTLLNARTEPKPGASRESKSASPETIVPKTCIADLTGESSLSEESEDETEDVSDMEERRRVNANMLAYHEAAEKLMREYGCWLEAGERLRATPHHADIARFIPEHALMTARAEQLNCMRPPLSAEDADLRAPRRPPSPDPPPTPLQSAVRRIMSIRDRSDRRSQVPTITSPVGDVQFANTRQLYMLVDKHLADLETFARQWASDVNRVATLDSKLWPLVSALRYRKTLPAVRKQCPNNCGAVVLALQGHAEWPISENAARGIAENRSSANSALRELLRTRPKEAKTVAALNTIARSIPDREAAANVAQRAWACAGAVADCAAARAALVSLLEHLADRWLCSDADAMCALVPPWCSSASSPAQHALCRALLGRGAARAHRPRLYVALLAALCARPQHPQTAFSYLSKFDVTRYTDEDARRDMLEALLSAAQRWGCEPDPELNILLELIGVQTAALTSPEQLPRVVSGAARAAAAGCLPPAHLAHVARAAAVAKGVPFDQLGHLLRELGVVWWQARSAPRAPAAALAACAQHVAALQHALLRALVAQARALSYAPERVSQNAWSALQESWAAWVSPHPALPPLLPSEGRQYTAMVKRFLDNVHQMMLDCPGCEEHLLSQVWEWTVQIYLNVTAAPSAGDSRIQLSELLAQIGTLPWREHQWPRASCLPAALQISTTCDMEMQTWLADTLRGIEAATWLRGVPDVELAPRLAALLRLCAGPLRLRTETLEQAVHLPWQRLPELALDQALDRFFVDHHNPQHPYHDTPQFRVILAASGLDPPCLGARTRRACFVSQWTRAASAPTLLAHVASQANELLGLLAALEPYTEEGSDELEELFGRAAVIMCMEPAAAEAVPVWEQWIARASPRVLRACVSAARAITTLEHFARVADAAAAALMNAGGTWCEIVRRLRGCAWASPRPLLQRGRLHAAYALALAAPAHPVELSAVSFVGKETMVSVWICALCRAGAAGVAGEADEAGEAGAAGEVGTAGVSREAARAQLARWAEPPRMALLRVLAGADEPTDKHRLLCRLALCILTPSSEPLITSLSKAYEACSGVLVPHEEVISWGRAPSLTHLPALALALFPAEENYFGEEVRLAV